MKLLQLFKTRLARLRDDAETARLEAQRAQSRAYQALFESHLTLLDNYVDPREAYYDGNERWLATGIGGAAARQKVPYANEAELAEIRGTTRGLAAGNPFARSGHQNRINYLIGPGHRYAACARPQGAARRGEAAAARLAAEVQQVLARFVQTSRWNDRQQEVVRRLDRDGECFLRFFPARAADGYLHVRFVEPDQVRQPDDQPEASFGIATDPEDVETVRGYWIDGLLVPAAEVQHRKWNVDSTNKRGLPTFYTVIRDLRSAEKLLRNMSALVEAQSAVAIIREHTHGTAAGVQSFADAVATYKSSQSSGSVRQQHLAPGTILDVGSDLKYHFPAVSVNAANIVNVLQARLRAIAAALVMPEFMLTADASNSNYASTLVAEGPAVKNFERLQHDLISDDLAVLRLVVARAAELGDLPEDTLELVDIQTKAPTLATRDKLAEAQANQIRFEAGVLSKRSWRLLDGLEDEVEERNRAEEVAME